MNVVNQLWSRVSTYYKTLNPATLTGAIDVIVVRQHDGSLKSSPFHARFGKTGILRPQENVVDLYVNDELIPDIQMKLGEAGEAFFLEDPDDVVAETGPSELLTQPLQTLAQDSHGEVPQGPGAEGASPGSLEQQEEEEGSPAMMSYYSDCDGEERVGTGSRRGTLTGYKSDSENDNHASAAVIGGAADQLVAQMNWEWGQLPHSATMDSVKSADYFDCNDEPGGAGPATPPPAAANPTASIQVSGELVSSEKLSQIIEERTSVAARAASQRDRLSSSGECYLSDLDDSNRHIYLNGSPASPESGYKSDQEMASVEEDLNVGIQLSLCGGLDLPKSITTERFLKHLVSFDEFQQNPDIIENKDLVVRIQGKNYNWRTAAPILLCPAAFGVPLPHRAVQGLKERYMRFRRKRATVRYWFGWGGARAATEDAEPNDEESAVAKDPPTDGSLAVTDIKEAVAAKLVEPQSAETQQPRQLVRTVRLSSRQLLKLNLKPGYNELRYSVTTKYQGTTECACGIYLWCHDDRIVISDIDGTITKSDVLGHILPMVGRDWTQPRIAKLFSAIVRNDYRFVYLSARAIGQSAVTRRFLHRIRQEGVPLPDGPVLLSPLSLMRAFHQEVIARRPEAFKIACLKDVRALFPEDAHPFWAGFGNRPSDALSYTEVGVSRARCFTVNPQGEVTRESGGRCLPSSYHALAEVADHVFPPFQHCFAGHDSYSQFSYWRDPLPELLLGEPAGPGIAETEAKEPKA